MFILSLLPGIIQQLIIKSSTNIGIFDFFSKKKNNHETNLSHNDNSSQSDDTPQDEQIQGHGNESFDKGRKQFDSTANAYLYNFFARRLAYLYVEYEWWEPAKHLLEQMKENPGCHDFALQELNYIRLVTGQ